MIGNLQLIRYKFDRWLDSVLIQKELGAGHRIERSLTELEMVSI